MLYTGTNSSNYYICCSGAESQKTVIEKVIKNAKSNIVIKLDAILYDLAYTLVSHITASKHNIKAYILTNLIYPSSESLLNKYRHDITICQISDHSWQMLNLNTDMQNCVIADGVSCVKYINKNCVYCFNDKSSRFLANRIIDYMSNEVSNNISDLHKKIINEIENITNTSIHTPFQQQVIDSYTKKLTKFSLCNNNKDFSYLLNKVVSLAKRSIVIKRTEINIDTILDCVRKHVSSQENDISIFIATPSDKDEIMKVYYSGKMKFRISDMEKVYWQPSKWVNNESIPDCIIVDDKIIIKFIFANYNDCMYCFNSEEAHSLSEQIQRYINNKILDDMGLIRLKKEYNKCYDINDCLTDSFNSLNREGAPFEYSKISYNQEYYYVESTAATPYEKDTPFHVNSAKYTRNQREDRIINSNNVFYTKEEATEFCNGLNKAVIDYMNQWKNRKSGKRNKNSISKKHH